MSTEKAIDLHWPLSWEYQHSYGYGWSRAIKIAFGSTDWRDKIESCRVTAQPPDKRNRNKERIERYIRWGLGCDAIGLKPESIRVSDTPEEKGNIRLIVRLKGENE